MTCEFKLRHKLGLKNNKKSKIKLEQRENPKFARKCNIKWSLTTWL